MAAEIYVKEVQASPLNAKEAGEVIEEGDFVTAHAGGELTVTDPETDGLPDGVVPNRERGPHLREHVQDYGPVQYDEGEGPVPFYQIEDGSLLTEEALTASETIEVFEEVALDADGGAVPADSGAAVTEAVGTALRYAEAGDGVHVRVGL